MKRSATTCLVFIVMLLTGCAGGPTANVDYGRAPRDLTLELKMSTTDKKHTYFKLTPNARLHFGGGIEAIHGNATPVTRLRTEQLEAIWRVIEQHDLLNADGSLFARPEDIDWHLKVRAAGERNSLHAVDDQIPGLKTLHDLLFEMQAEVRYDLPGIGAEYDPDRWQ